MDPLANMIVTIKNGYMARKPDVLVPFSKFKWQIAKVLENEKLVGQVSKKDNKIDITLIYEAKSPKINQIKQISKQGLRIYSKVKHLKSVKGGRGTVIISTPKGVMTDKDARRNNLGGEVICEIW